MTVHYISTRGASPVLSFDDAVLAGLAPDGGLYVPDAVPVFSMAEIAGLQGMSYPELAYTIISRFVGFAPPLRGSSRGQAAIAAQAEAWGGDGDAVIIPPTLRASSPMETCAQPLPLKGGAEGELASIIGETYKTFRHPAIAPLTQLDAHTFVLELFHGLTLAFKDFALQFLGRWLEHVLEKRREKAVIVGATSGDTGSAAIEGCRGRKNMEIFILHPKGRVSDVQRRQMTTVQDKNVHNIAIEGTFDDCQDIVKSLFADEGFRKRRNLAAVNSINWARIVAQIPYYFYAALALGAPAKAVSFSVPTGNFGDIYAGYMAKKMGLPIDRLIIATNRNDILTRCLNTGVYGMEGVVPTISPSMDIQISSNFERLLFDLHQKDGARIADMMARFRKEKKLALEPLAWNRLKEEFSACAIGDEDTKKTIAEIYKATGELLDPHTAVGVAAAQRVRCDTATLMITLATAHPAKFPDAVKEATGVHPALPEHMADLFNEKERFEVLPNDSGKVKAYIEQCAV